MQFIKNEQFVFKDKPYTIRVWQSLQDYIVQAFQGEIPVTYQFLLAKSQADDMKCYYSTNPVEMMISHIRRIVEDNQLLELEKLMIATNSKEKRIIK